DDGSTTFSCVHGKHLLQNRFCECRADSFTSLRFSPPTYKCVIPWFIPSSFAKCSGTFSEWYQRCAPSTPFPWPSMHDLGQIANGLASSCSASLVITVCHKQMILDTAKFSDQRFGISIAYQRAVR